MKAVISAVALGFVGLLACSGFNPCGAGQQECADGTCAPAGNACCGNGTSCPSGYACGVGDTCLSPAVNRGVNACEGCVSSGQECCLNGDGTVDCAPIGATCCGNHRYCAPNTVCLNGGTSCG